VRLEASLLLLLVGNLANGGSSAARAAPPGQIGATSKGSISISVSVRPQVKLSQVAAPNGLLETVTTGTGPAEHICLFASATSGNYSLLLQSSGNEAPNGRSAQLVTSAAATSICGSVQGAARARAIGFGLPASNSERPYLLLIAPE
jgi:hypothetical protein